MRPFTHRPDTVSVLHANGHDHPPLPQNAGTRKKGYKNVYKKGNTGETVFANPLNFRKYFV